MKISVIDMITPYHMFCNVHQLTVCYSSAALLP